MSTVENRKIGGKERGSSPELRPYALSPCYKDFLWGGGRLQRKYGKSAAPPRLAESWELADLEAGRSDLILEDGSFLPLSELIPLSPRAFFGSRFSGERLPVLVKLIDAEKDLSVQVHPSDRTADASRGEAGKAEMWYIAECRSGASLYLGFRRDVTREEFLRTAKAGTVCDLLNRVPVKKGDVFFIRPGTVHAIGAGIVVAEIQQASNTTFRVYDFNRRDAGGNLRPLHLERAAAVADFHALAPAECRATGRVSFPAFTLTEMFLCEYFKAYSLDVRAECAFRGDGESFRHLLCVEGEAELRHAGRAFPLVPGGSLFLPAAIGEYTLQGKARLLLTRL